MLLKLLEDGVHSLLKLSHTEMHGVNLSVLSVIPEHQDLIICPKSGHTNKCALLLMPKQQVMLVIQHTPELDLLLLQQIQLKMEQLQIHHGHLLLLSHYGLMEICIQMLLQLIKYGLKIRVYKLNSQVNFGQILLELCPLFHNQLLQPLLIPSPVLPEPPLSLPPAPPSSPSPLSTETECRA